jgi:tetratricopeptide (TPR) repeat protein
MAGRRLTGEGAGAYRQAVRTARAPRIAVLVLASLAWAPLRAATSPEAEVERLADEAVKAYKAANYPRAAHLYERAYAIRPVAALLYNLAKVYDKAGDVESARATYRRFVNAPDAESGLKVKAETRLAVLDAGRHPPPATPEPPPPIATPSPVAPEPSVTPTPAPPPAVAAAPSPAELRARARHRNRVIAIGSGAATLACGVVAIALSGSALALQRDYDATTSYDRKTQLRHDALVRAGTADVFYIATAVGAAVTGVFVYLGFRPERPARALALVPLLGPTGGGLVAAGRF